MTASETPLAAVAALLEQSGMTVELERVAAGLSLERLKLLLPTDRYGSDTVLQLVFINDLTDAVAASTGDAQPDLFGDEENDADEDAGEDPGEDHDDEDDEDAVLLHFSIVLPFKASGKAVPDTLRVVMAINRMLPVGAFGYGESDHGLYLAYPLALDSREGLTALVLEDVINMLGFAVDNYAAVIESVARGEIKAGEILKEMRDAGLEPLPVGDPPVMRQHQH